MMQDGEFWQFIYGGMDDIPKHGNGSNLCPRNVARVWTHMISSDPKAAERERVDLARRLSTTCLILPFQV